VRTPTELAIAWRDALVARDAPAYGDLFAVDAEFSDVEHRTADGSAARAVIGRAAILAVCVDWLASTPAFTYEILDVVGDDRRAAKRWRYRVGEADIEGVTWLDCADGVIDRALVLFDVVPLGMGMPGPRRSST
jgi:SnoaL-like domain